MKELSKDEVVDAFLDTEMCPTKRKVSGSHDWGDQGTVKLHVKRYGANPLSSWDHFGIYLGSHSSGYIVMITGDHIDEMKGEAFDTIEEMKQRWQLD